MEVAALAQRGLTVLSSGFNALYFATYRPVARRRRWAAAALVLLNAALLLEALYLGILPLWQRGGHPVLLAPRPLLLSGLLPLLASLLITGLVLRRHLRRRR